MSDRDRDAGRLRADLAELRAALRAVQAPPPDEAELRGEFRAAAQRAQSAARASRAAGSWRLHAAAAAVVVLAVGAALAAALLSLESPVPPAVPVASGATQPRALAVSAFQPLMNAPASSPASSYSVVRVRIPLSAFALVPGTEHNGTIEADLLVGEDGLARAIRFDEADASLVSVAKQ
jgi:hypothetical protein